MADSGSRFGAASRWVPAIYLAFGLLWIFGSDLLVGLWFSGSPELVLRVGTFKGVMFVTLTAVLLYFVMSTRSGVADVPADTVRPAQLWRPIVAFVIFGLPVAVTGLLVYSAEYQSNLSKTSATLESAADVSARVAQLWIDGQVRALRQLVTIPSTTNATLAVAEGKAAAGPILQKRLEAFRTSQGLVSVQVFATNDSVVAVSGAEMPMSPAFSRVIQDALQVDSGDDDVGVFWQSNGTNRTQYVDFVMRFGDRPRPKMSRAGVVVARADATDLVGLIAASALTGLNTGVTLLVTSDGASVRYLSRDISGARNAGVPVAEVASHELASARVISGDPGPFTAVDASGTPVLTAGRPVKGTPWYVVTQVSLSEIAVEQRIAFMQAWGLGAAGLVLVAALVLLWWRNEQARFALSMQKEQTRADIATQRFAMISRHAGDVMLLLEEDGRIADVNHRAAEVYGRSEAELVGTTIFDLQADEARELALVHAGPDRPGTPPLCFEAMHRRRDGTPFPVEVNAVRVDFQGQDYVLCIVRDISVRRMHELEISRLARERDWLLHRLQLQFDSLPIGCVLTDTADAVVDVNPAFERLFGYGLADMQVAAAHDLIFPPEAREERIRTLAALSSAGGPITATRENLTRSGRRVTCRWTVAVLRETDGTQIGTLAMCQDVSDIAAAEALLRASEGHLKTAQRLARVGSWEVDLATMHATYSDETYRICGVSRSELTGSVEAAFALVHPEDRVGLRARLASVMAGTGPQDEARFRIVCANGRVAHVSARGRLERDPSGRPVRIVGALHDITRIVVAQRQAERQRDLYDLLAQSNQLIARSADANTMFREVTALVVAQHRYLFAWVGECGDDDVIRRLAACGDDGGYIDALLEADAGCQLDPRPPCVTSLRGRRMALSNMMLDDPRLQFAQGIVRGRGIRSMAAFPIGPPGAAGPVLMVYSADPDAFDPQALATIEDLADDMSFGLEAMATRNALAETTNLLQTIIDGTESPIYAADAVGRILLANTAWRHANNCGGREVVGCHLEEILAPDAFEQWRFIERRIVESDRSWIAEERGDVDGLEKLWLVNRFPLRDVSGRIYGVCGISADVTGMRRMEEELIEANRGLEARIAARTSELEIAKEQAERADRTKSSFLSTMSHELRTPLNSVLGFTEIMLDGLSGPLNEEQRRQLGIVKGASLHLLELINDVLDIARVEAGELRLELTEVDVADVLRRRAEELMPLAERKGIALECEIVDPVTPIHSDRRRVSQIVGNLLSNAVKFTDSGRVTASIRHQEGSLEVSVQDTGCGIQREDLEELFVPFAQLKGKPEAAEGTGLGLAISRHFARALGGDIAVQSEPGVGSCFTVTLPLTTLATVELASTGVFRRIPRPT